MMFLSNLTVQANLRMKGRLTWREPKIWLKYKIPPPVLPPAAVECSSKLRIIEMIRRNLTPRQTTMFRATCFGHFLQLPTDLTFQGKLIHNVLVRELYTENVEDQLWYLLGGRPCRFSKTEFALITGLKMGPREDNENSFDKFLPTVPDWTNLGMDRPVTLVEFEDEFSTIDWSAEKDEIAVRFAMVLFLHRTLLGLPDEAIIDTEWLRLAQDIGMFNNYPWGLLVWEPTYDSIVLIMNSWATQNVRCKTTMLRPANHTFVLRGFAFAAQV